MLTHDSSCTPKDTLLTLNTCIRWKRSRVASPTMCSALYSRHRHKCSIQPPRGNRYEELLRDAQLPNQFRCQTSNRFAFCVNGPPWGGKKLSRSTILRMNELFPDRSQIFQSGSHLETENEALVELSGIEPLTPCLQSRCSPN